MTYRLSWSETKLDVVLSLKEKNTPEIVTKPACVEGTFAGPVVLGTGLQAVGAGVGVGVKTKHIMENGARTKGALVPPLSIKTLKLPAGQGAPVHPLQRKQPAE